jgi:IS5 family transposase
MDSLRERSEDIRPPLAIREYVKRLYTGNTPVARVEPSSHPVPPDTKPSDADAGVPPRYRRTRPDGHRRKANNELVSRTDPEATVVSRRGFDMRLAYKAHVTVAGAKGQVITAAIATTGAKADEHLSREMLRYHSELTNLPVKKVVADAKYGIMANYEFLHKTGMTAFIPPRQRIRRPRGIWGSTHFCYLREEDIFLCPAGKPMKRFASRASTQRVSYRAPKGACVGCQFREQCTPTGQDRTISRFFGQTLVDEAKERLSTSTGQELLKQRKVRVEGVFTLAKELHGLRRTRFMGRWKVQMQLWLTAAAINIKRAAKQLSKTDLSAGSGQVAHKVSVTGRFVHAAKDIAGGMYRLILGLRNHFGNSPR